MSKQAQQFSKFENPLNLWKRAKVNGRWEMVRDYSICTHASQVLVRSIGLGTFAPREVYRCERCGKEFNVAHR